MDKHWADKKWMKHYEEAKEYFQEHGNLDVPVSNKLNVWIRQQRYAMHGKRGRITSEQISLLNELNMRWDTDRHIKWLKFYEEAKLYYEIHGQLNIPDSYISPNGYKLGKWITYQRHAYRVKNSESPKKAHTPLITDEEVTLLESLGMIWDVSWLGKSVSLPEIIIYHYIKQYYPDTIKLKSGDLLKMEIDIYIPSEKVGIEYDGYVWHRNKKKKDEKKGIKCQQHGIKLIHIREIGLERIEHCHYNYFVHPNNLYELQNVIEDLLYHLIGKKVKCNIKKDYNSIIKDHINYNCHQWDQIYKFLLEQYNKDGFIDVPSLGIHPSGINLYRWVSLQRANYKKGKLTEEQSSKLLNIGISLCPTVDSWNEWIDELKDYKKQNGNINVPANYVSPKGLLGAWLSTQRCLYRQGSLSQDCIELLESMDIVWNVLEENDSIKKQALSDYYSIHGTINMPVHTVFNNLPLSDWIQGKKKLYKKNKLSQEEIDFFESLGISWYSFDDRWKNAFKEAKNFYEQYGHLILPVRYVSPNGFNLWQWISHQRQKYRKKKLTEEQISQLESIGMIWNLYEEKWLRNYNYLKLYYEDYGNIDIPAKFVYHGIKLGMWLNTQRQAYRGNPNYTINIERIYLLNKLGMNWMLKDKTDPKKYQRFYGYILFFRKRSIQYNFI